MVRANNESHDHLAVSFDFILKPRFRKLVIFSVSRTNFNTALSYLPIKIVFC